MLGWNKILIYTVLRKEAKNDFQKDIFKLMNNAAFEKMMKNLKKYRDIKLATTERSRNYLVSKPNYHTTNIFTENLLALEMKKIETLTNEPVFVGLLMLELSKILMYESWYDYVKSD